MHLRSRWSRSRNPPFDRFNAQTASWRSEDQIFRWQLVWRTHTGITITHSGSYSQLLCLMVSILQWPNNPCPAEDEVKMIFRLITVQINRFLFKWNNNKVYSEMLKEGGQIMRWSRDVKSCVVIVRMDNRGHVHGLWNLMAACKERQLCYFMLS